MRSGSNRILMGTQKFSYLPLYFVGYSLVGWIYEVLLLLVRDGRLLNRGFLTGPWLPIYGVGGILVYFFVYPYSQQELNVKVGKYRINIMSCVLFIAISLIAAIVELFSTYVMDFFHVDWTILWEYYEFRWNFDGRIAVVPSAVFGLCGVAMLRYVQPMLEDVRRNLNRRWVKWSYYLVLFMFTVDMFIHLRTGCHYTDVAIWTFRH